MNRRKTSAAGKKAVKPTVLSGKKVCLVLIFTLLIGMVLGIVIERHLGRGSFQPIELKRYLVHPENGEGALKLLARAAEEYSEITGHTVSTLACGLDIRIANSIKEIKVDANSAYYAYPTLIRPGKVELRVNFDEPVR